MPHKDAEVRRGFDVEVTCWNQAKAVSLFFDGLFDAKLRGFTRAIPKRKAFYLASFAIFILTSMVTGNLLITCATGGNFDHEGNRERDLILIGYGATNNNVFEVTEEFAYQNRAGTQGSIINVLYRS